MKNFLRTTLTAAVVFASLTASADNNGRLYIIGSATPSNWELDLAQALLSTSEAPNVYSGTIYLTDAEGATFKFMEQHEWGSTEYALPTDAESDLVNGDVTLASGTLDNGYKQMAVATAGNYHIVVDTETLQADITLAGYQESEIKYCSLFLVGSATENGWAVENGTPLYQDASTPYVFKSVVPLKAKDGDSDASFKITTAIRGGGSFDSKYFMFRDADDAGKISTDGTGDRQWSVPEDGKYTVTVDTKSNTISIDKYNESAAGVDSVTMSGNVSAEYYDLYGRKVPNPTGGLYVEVKGTTVRKVMLK